MGPCKHWDVHRYVDRVGLVETHAKVPLSTQQQQDKHTDVYQAHTSCTHTHTQSTYNNKKNTHTHTHCSVGLTLVSPCIIQVKQDRHQDIQNITALQHEEQELLKHKDSKFVG